MEFTDNGIHYLRFHFWLLCSIMCNFSFPQLLNNLNKQKICFWHIFIAETCSKLTQNFFFNFWLIQYFIVRDWTLVTHNGMDISEIIPLLVTHSTWDWRKIMHLFEDQPYEGWCHSIPSELQQLYLLPHSDKPKNCINCILKR